MGEVITGKALDIITHLMDADKETLWDLSLHKDKRKRTLNSNKYYWTLVEELAVKTHVPKMKIHNLYLRQVGLTEKFADKPVYFLIPDTDVAEEQVLLSSTYHLAPRRETKLGADGIMYRWYVLLKGSRDMTVDQFSMLVDLVVQDAKEQGIEVLTPDELAHMRELERENEQKSNNQHCNG